MDLAGEQPYSWLTMCSLTRSIEELDDEAMSDGAEDELTTEDYGELCRDLIEYPLKYEPVRTS